MQIGFIGLGNMATAIIGGLLSKGNITPDKIIGSDKTEESKRKAEESFGITGRRPKKATFSFLP